MSSPAVPSIPPLSSITDPNVRAVLQAMVDGQRIRNGDIGDGNEKFLTVADLNGGLNGINGGYGSNGSNGSNGARGAAGAVALIIQKLSDKIMQSRAWKLLDERIEWIATPEWFNAKFASSITTEQGLRSDQNGELAQQITTVFTNLNGSLAGVQDEITAQSTTTTALAQRVTTVVTEFNGNLGLVQQKLTSTSDLAGATARSTTQLQTDVGGVRSIAKESLELVSTLDGTVQGTKVIAFDLNGYIAGTCLTADQVSGKKPTSAFVVRADTFAVGHPGVQNVVPFFVEGGKTYIDIAMIKYASIDGAYIKDLTVDTLHMVGNSITVAVPFEQHSGTIYPLGTVAAQWTSDPIWFNFPTSAPQSVSFVIGLAAYGHADGGGTTCGVRVVRQVNSTVTTVFERAFTIDPGWVTSVSVSGLDMSPPIGEYLYKVQLFNTWGTGGTWHAAPLTVVALATLK